MSDAAGSEGSPEGRLLLPNTVEPSRYEIEITPNLERFDYLGKQKIFVTVCEATSEITLHAKELHFVSVLFKPSEGDEQSPDSILLNLKATTVTFAFADMLPVGEGVIEIDFIGVLNDQMAGFSRSSYVDVHGESKMLVSTDFEPCNARRCFPCWDEPSRKAVFALTLVVDPALVAFSNMPEKSVCTRKCGPNNKVMKELAFMDSPKMSTYLVCMVVGEFDFLQATTEHGVLIRVYTPPGRSSSATFALSCACKCLDLYDDFFGLPFPLPKLDMVAIPEYAAGAMENWGLVTYRETAILIESTASNTQKQDVAITVNHELAHQWFGNLVTMAWWDDLWLNEGFASWCENYATNELFPEYRVWDQFGSEVLEPALDLDGLTTSHPIQVPIYDAEEVDEVFDAISYCKGAAVIRMAHAVLGAEAFKRGLQQYMDKHQYSNTETHDLWNAWASASGLDVKEMMSSWTMQMGYPLVTVKEFRIEGQVAKLVLEQAWFLSSGEEPSEEKTWHIPLFIRTSKGVQDAPIFMTSKTQAIEVPLDSDLAAEFVLLNAGVQTPMRMLYVGEMRARIVKAMAAGLIPADERAALVNDAYSLARAGKLSTDEMFIFIAGFKQEADYIVWNALSGVFFAFRALLMGGASADLYGHYLGFVEKFVSHGWESAALGWEPRATDSHTDGLFRSLLMKLVATFAGGPAFLAEARSRFNRYIVDPEANAAELPDAFRTSVLKSVLQHGGKEEYEQIRSAFKKLTKNVDQVHVLSTIGYVKDASLKHDALMWSISGEVKLQDFSDVISSVSRSSAAGLDMSWQFFQNEFSALTGLLKTSPSSLMESVIQSCMSSYSSAAKADAIEEFFKKHPLPQNKRTISQVLEEIRGSAAFVDRVLATEGAKAEFWIGLFDR